MAHERQHGEVHVPQGFGRCWVQSGSLVWRESKSIVWERRDTDSDRAGVVTTHQDRPDSRLRLSEPIFIL
eukprot:CAMPEP_0115828756 /NCGR_PEP_ID=MMETSP0287-20121206/739_1 /TAXON_ID=412157 /ORGANISM="Chrysochromulina rotalis, Strain UIO044" /LENGTH=69 /DNA_ID=CAMNT_0003281985 /DNA_START=490 /DNA_END=699 /DNA_ORIENTATION=+